MTQVDLLRIVSEAISEEANTDDPQKWREHNTTAFLVAKKAAQNAAMEMARYKNDNPSIGTVKKITCYVLKHTNLVFEDDDYLKNSVNWNELIQKALEYNENE